MLLLDPVCQITFLVATHTSCLKVYSALSSPSLVSAFLMRASCCSISLW